MRQFNYNILSIEGLVEILKSKEMPSTGNFQSLLVQIFSVKNDFDWYYSLGNEIRSTFPKAVIIGASSVGEINQGKIHTNATVVLFSFFENSSVNLLSYECKSGNEEETGRTLIKDIESLDLTVKGILLLSTPISNDSGKIFNILTVGELAYPVFGGGAGDYANQKKTLVFDGTYCYKEGILSVIFSGNSLHIEALTCLGWQPLSKEMTITDVGEVSVKSIDGSPAFSVYEKYLGIKADSNFFQNSLEFPFLMYRDNHIIARTPFFVNEDDGSIQLVADVQAGEKFRIGYGNPQLIKDESIHLQLKMQDFKPEAIFLYSCICRRFLMQDEVDFETLPFNAIAPTAGFYTFGEFFADCNFKSLLNSSLVAVGFREGDKQNTSGQKEIPQKQNSAPNPDPYFNQHNRILSRLLYFIKELIKEHDGQNQLLKDLNEQQNEFLGMAAHDLRNPIGIIQGFSDFLEEQLDGELKEYASIISKESSTMLYLLNDLLDISKIEAGRLDLKKTKTNYAEFVKQNIELNNFIAQKKNIKIESDFEITNLFLEIDGGKIEQVLNNFLSNATKYSYPDSKIEVKIFIEGNQVVTQIIDQGQGIPEEELDGIFNPFKKTSIHPTGSESSHGLGLAIVKKIIEGHSGNVGVTSNFGKGSIFFFTLPLKVTE
jgi:signal transduction histidine kinase